MFDPKIDSKDLWVLTQDCAEEKLKSFSISLKIVPRRVKGGGREERPNGVVPQIEGTPAHFIETTSTPCFSDKAELGLDSFCRLQCLLKKKRMI